MAQSAVCHQRRQGGVYRIAGSNTPERKYEVTPLELFFDLVFVFAVSQLSRHLLTHLSPRGAIETLVLMVAVFAVWSHTSWAATMIGADQARTRWMVLAVMLLSLFMNASVTRAFTSSGWAFVVPLLLVQLGRTFWTQTNFPELAVKEHFFWILIWFIASSPLWIVGATVKPEARLPWWGIAASIVLIGMLLGHPVPGRWLRSEGIYFPGSHMLERCRLFVVIALGETVITTGTAIDAAPTTLMTVVTGTAALVGIVAIWSLVFGRADQFVVRHVEETRDPYRANRHAVSALMGIVVGLIAMAVADEVVIRRPHAHLSIVVITLLYGGPILILLAQGWYLWFVPRVRPRLHLVGSAVLVAAGFAALAVQAYVALILIGVILAALALIDR